MFGPCGVGAHPVLTGPAQGAEGTDVSMTVQPRGAGAARQLALTRRKVMFNPVTSRLCGGTPRTGYLRVSTFSKQTAEGVAAALRALKARMRAGFIGLLRMQRCE